MQSIASHKLDKILQLLLIFFIQSACKPNNEQDITHPKREFRAIWIVTLDNKDFPSRMGLSTIEQREELIEVIDFSHRKGINAVFFQVRPSADAFYSSAKEPWSEWITGKQGEAPKPFYDPLQFVIDECKKRNMEVHAWFNPYRGTFTEKSDIHPNHITKRRPDWFITYGKRMHFNPGLPEVRTYVVDVVMDVVKRYDIDGVHFDDYFYPYSYKGQDFGDEITFRYFRGIYTDKKDWRRQNINLLIQAVHDSIQKNKPCVKFGVSPLGVWRNRSADARGSATSVGQSGYDHLGADALKWLAEGWIDYIAPQLYWSIGHKNADYQTLADWWSANTFGKHLYIGQAFFKIDNDDDLKWKNPAELPNQMRINRTRSGVNGSIFFRARSLMENTNYVSDTLKNQFYKYPALIPPMSWKDSIAPLPPQNLRSIHTKTRIILKWDTPEKALDGEIPQYYVVYRFDVDDALNLNDASKIISIQKQRSFNEKIPEVGGKKRIYVVTSVDRLHNESVPSLVE